MLDNFFLLLFMYKCEFIIVFLVVFNVKLEELNDNYLFIVFRICFYLVIC